MSLCVGDKTNILSTFDSFYSFLTRLQRNMLKCIQQTREVYIRIARGAGIKNNHDSSLN